jgi:Protein of unknown function (DUF2795)
MHELQASKTAQAFLDGLEYPISKAGLIDASRVAKLGSTIEDALGKLPDRDYEDGEDVTQALNAAN